MYIRYLNLVFLCIALTVAASDVCNSGIYGLLKPLAKVPEAAAFCSAKFPTVVTASKTKRAVNNNSSTSKTTTRTTKSSTKSTTTTRNQAGTTSNTKTTTPSNTKSTATTTTTKSTSSSSSEKQQLLATLSACAYNVASTFCSCNFPPKTVQPTATAPSLCAAPPSPTPTQCAVNDQTCTDTPAPCASATSEADCNSQCQALVNPAGGDYPPCGQYSYDANTGSCYLAYSCCPYGQQKKHRLLRSIRIAEKRTWLKKKNQA